MFIEQPPNLFRRLYPDAIWRINPNERAIYLTFDDGPIPEVTPWVLDQLNKYQIKATFFMVGDNVRKFPEEFYKVVEQGHRVGNHTFNHIRGFEYSAKEYLENTEQAHILMENYSEFNTRELKKALYPLLFRPPHGHMFALQYTTLKQRYKIIMWDVVTRDYSNKLNGLSVLKNVVKYTRNGSIITFHDAQRSWKNGNLQYALPRAIQYLKAEGYQFKLL